MLRLARSNAIVGTVVLSLLVAGDAAIGQETRLPAGDGEILKQALEDFVRGTRVVGEIATLADKRKDAADRASRRDIDAVADRVRNDSSLQGGYYEFQATKRMLKETDLDRGTAQLRRMLHDRPKMARGLTKDDELFQWAARKFAGEDLPTWIEWRNSSEDPYGFEASHRSPTDGTPGEVFVREFRVPRQLLWKGDDYAFDKLWSQAAFELHNIQSHREFRELQGKVIAGKLGREEYILGNARLEHDALLRTRLFYLEVYYPWAKERSIETNPYDWRIDVPDSFEQWIATYPPSSIYPWRVYGEDFERTARWGQYYRQHYEETIRLHNRAKSWDQLLDALKREFLKRERLEELWNKITANLRQHSQLQLAHQTV